MLTGFIILTVLTIIILIVVIYSKCIGDNDFLPGLACSLGILIVGDINVGMAAFSPHEGKNPTMSDVAKNEAYVDTVYTISKNDTIVDYQVKWND